MELQQVVVCLQVAWHLCFEKQLFASQAAHPALFIPPQFPDRGKRGWSTVTAIIGHAQLAREALQKCCCGAWSNCKRTLGCVGQAEACAEGKKVSCDAHDPSEMWGIGTKPRLPIAAPQPTSKKQVGDIAPLHPHPAWINSKGLVDLTTSGSTTQNPPIRRGFPAPLAIFSGSCNSRLSTLSTSPRSPPPTRAEANSWTSCMSCQHLPRDWATRDYCWILY